MDRRWFLTASTVAVTATPFARAWPQTSAPAAPAPAAGDASGQSFTAAQLDQMLAPIALYPDGLLAQVMMAATYPLEIVEAERWVQSNPSLKGDAAVNAAKGQGWDASVTSLVAFPQVLAMMNSKLDWTTKIGDAMLAQQSDVAASIQRLRAQAKDAGNLKSTPQQTVTTRALSSDAPSGTPAPIVIEPANPQLVYVPYYNPLYVYGAWPYAAYLPIYFPPPAPAYGYAAGMLTGLAFGIGIGMAAGGFFGGWAWHGGWGGGWGWGGWNNHWGNNNYVTVNNNVTNIDHNYFHGGSNDGNWHYNPAHRYGVPYGNKALTEKYGQRHPTAAQDSAFRGRLEDSPHPTANPRAGEAQRGGAERAGQYRGYENRGNAFSGIDRGAQVNREASRGWAHADHASWQPHGGGFFGGGGYHGYGGGGFRSGGFSGGFHGGGRR